MDRVKSWSEDNEDEKLLAVASFHSGGESEGEKKSCLSRERKPMSTSARTNSGKPAYRRVPRMMKWASGIEYFCANGVESWLGYATNAKPVNPVEYAFADTINSFPGISLVLPSSRYRAVLPRASSIPQQTTKFVAKRVV